VNKGRLRGAHLVDAPRFNTKDFKRNGQSMWVRYESGQGRGLLTNWLSCNSTPGGFRRILALRGLAGKDRRPGGENVYLHWADRGYEEQFSLRDRGDMKLTRY